MRHAVYERTGGVRGAVGRLAEETYASLSEPEREAAKRILLRLADAGEHEAGFVRRRMPLEELDVERDEHTAGALAALIDSRLVTADGETLEVAHEALLREWPRLRAWLEEDADGRRLHQRLINASRDWQAGGRDSGELYRGARLAAALDWQAGHEGELNELERTFLHHSGVEAEQEHEYQRRTNRRLRALLAGVAALLAIAVVAGVVALNQRGEARDAALTADAQRLGAEALNQKSLDQGLLFARAAVALDETPATEGNLLSVLQRIPAALGVVDHGAGMYGAAISPDGKLMAIGDERGVVVVYDTATHQPLGRPYPVGGGLVQDVHFSPDGGTLAVSYLDENAPGNHSGMLDLIDPRSGERRLRVRAPALPGPAPFVYADVAFLADGHDLLMRPVDGTGPGGQAAPVYRVDGETGALTDRLLVGRYASNYNATETAGPPADVPHEPAGRPDLGAGHAAAARGAVLAGRGLRRRRQPRWTGVRTRLRDGTHPAARPDVRPGPADGGRGAWRGFPDALHTRRADARDLGPGWPGARLGRRPAKHRPALRRTQPRRRRARPHG